MTTTTKEVKKIQTQITDKLNIYPTTLRMPTAAVQPADTHLRSVVCR